MAESEIKIQLWDHWIHDPIDRGYEPIKIYALVEIGNTMKLLEEMLPSEEDDIYS